jgi:heme-degrading monooxygenase HmoA
MFIVVYKFKAKKGLESEFRSHWLTTTKSIYEESGSLGSRLHATEDPTVFIGYAQWPSKEKWAASQLTKPEHIQARNDMRKCLESSETLYEMEVVEDYLRS